LALKKKDQNKRSEKIKILKSGNQDQGRGANRVSYIREEENAQGIKLRSIIVKGGFRRKKSTQNSKEERKVKGAGEKKCR